VYAALVIPSWSATSFCVSPAFFLFSLSLSASLLILITPVFGSNFIVHQKRKKNEENESYSYLNVRITNILAFFKALQECKKFLHYYKGGDFVTKFRRITPEQLVQRVVSMIPEINPDYVRSVLSLDFYENLDVSDVPEWIQYFENSLYGRKGVS